MDFTGTLAADIDACIYMIKPVEFMRWGHENLADSLKKVLGEAQMPADASLHCKIGFASLLKAGPLHERIKHIVPDFVVVDANRHPIAILDYLGAGHDAGHDAAKAAVARKMGIGYVQVPVEFTHAELQHMLMQAFEGQAPREPAKADAHALQEMLKQQDFAQAA